MTHDSDTCKKRGVLNKMKDPEYRDELVKRLASRTKAAARSDQTSERSGMQQNPTRNSKHEQSVQSQQGQMSNAQQMQQIQPQMYAGYRKPYSQPMMSPQSSVEYVTL
jgi:DNA primase